MRPQAHHEPRAHSLETTSSLFEYTGSIPICFVAIWDHIVLLGRAGFRALGGTKIRDLIVIQVSLLFNDLKRAFSSCIGVAKVVEHAPLADLAGVDVEDLVDDWSTNMVAGI